MERHKQHGLLVIEGPGVGETYTLEGMIVTLGRSSDNSIVLDSPKISRHHAQIRKLPTGVVIEDMGSTNGTWVNERRLTGSRPLSPGDEIRLADYMTLEYIVEEDYRTTVLPPDETPGATQMMQEPPTYTPPQIPVEPRYPEPYEPPPQREVSYEPSAPTPPPASYQPSAEARPESITPPRQRPKWLYILIGLLAILICLCIATAVYLWFAPLSFWERLFDLFDIPMPTGTLIALIGDLLAA
ncbi:MAG: FHA domain-containing protein [Anaerolineae bacterium]